MITIKGEFATDTIKARISGKDSIILGIDREKCKLLEITKGSMVQVFFRKIGDLPNNEKSKDEV